MGTGAGGFTTSAERGSGVVLSGVELPLFAAHQLPVLLREERKFACGVMVCACSPDETDGAGLYGAAPKAPSAYLPLARRSDHLLAAFCCSCVAVAARREASRACPPARPAQRLQQSPPGSAALDGLRPAAGARRGGAPCE
jgi:hypothetical protein